MSVDMTKEQIDFYKGKTRISYLEEHVLGSGDHAAEVAAEEEIKQILMELHNRIIKFAMQQAHRMMSHYKLPGDAYSDVQQSMSAMILKKMDAYDPLRYTPTTYYLPYVQEVVTDYIAETLHMSKYHARNVRKIMKAAREYEAEGIQWTYDMISTKTGLSERVIRSTLEVRKLAAYTPIDTESAFQVKSSIAGPEEEAIKNENDRVLYERVNRLLTDEEKESVLMRTDVGVDGRATSFDDIADKLGLSLREVKTLYNSAILKLGEDPVLCSQFSSSRKKRRKKKQFGFQNGATDILLGQVMEALDTEGAGTK